MAKYTNTNTQIHKYTNTVWTKVKIGITCAIFLKSLCYEDVKINVCKGLT